MAGRGIVSGLKSGGEIAAEKLLAASGRSGRTAEVALDKVGAVVDKRGYVVVDDDYRTACPSVYAAGDVIGFPMLASTSMRSRRVSPFATRSGSPTNSQVSHLLPFGIYTIPEVSCVGLSEEMAKEQKIDFVVGRAF